MSKRRFVFSAAVSLMLILSSNVYAAPAGVIRGWSTQNNFNSATFDYTAKAAEATQWNLWPSTYTKVAVMKDCVAAVRDGYVGADGETVYDGVTGIKGDKYAYFAYSESWKEPDSNKNTGYLHFNDRSKPNGGLCYGAVRYELDIRVSDLTKGDYNACNGIQIYNADDKAVIKMPIYHGVGTTWYFSKPTGLSSSPDALNCGEWYRITIDADYKSKTVRYTAKAHNADSSKKGFAARTGSFESDLPLKPSLTVQCPLYASCSLDNMTVTKDTFAADEAQSSIFTADGKVQAVATVGCDVYADSRTSFGSAVDTRSPLAILALYDADKKLIGMTTAETVFDGHVRECDGTAADAAFFKSDIEYKPLTLSLDEPEGDYSARLYIWDSLDNIASYAPSKPIGGISE